MRKRIGRSIAKTIISNYILLPNEYVKLAYMQYYNFHDESDLATPFISFNGFNTFLQYNAHVVALTNG